LEIIATLAGAKSKGTISALKIEEEYVDDNDPNRI
jgi:hypothetical protein